MGKAGSILFVILSRAECTCRRIADYQNGELRRMSRELTFGRELHFVREWQADACVSDDYIHNDGYAVYSWSEARNHDDRVVNSRRKLIHHDG